MPKFARPNIYNGRQSNQAFTGTVRAATLNEAEEGESPELYISPQVLADMGAGFVPAATTTVPGVVELATNAEAVTGTATTNLAIIPASLTARLAAPGAIGGTTPAAGTFTSVTANGNITKNAAGNKDVYTSVGSSAAAGANSAGTATLVGGTVTIATTAVTASSLIRLYRQSVGATGAAATGNLSRGTIVAGTSFVINSVSAADATALATTDVSVVFWEIVN